MLAFLFFLEIGLYHQLLPLSLGTKQFFKAGKSSRKENRVLSIRESHPDGP